MQSYKPKKENCQYTKCTPQQPVVPPLSVAHQQAPAEVHQMQSEPYEYHHILRDNNVFTQKLDRVQKTKKNFPLTIFHHDDQ